MNISLIIVGGINHGKQLQVTEDTQDGDEVVVPAHYPTYRVENDQRTGLINQKYMRRYAVIRPYAYYLGEKSEALVAAEAEDAMSRADEPSSAELKDIIDDMLSVIYRFPSAPGEILGQDLWYRVQETLGILEEE